MGLFGGIAGIFGATQQKRAAQEAQRLILEARQEGREAAARRDREFAPFLTSAQDALTEAKSFDISSTSFDPVLKRLLTVAETGATEGLTEADRIAFEDAKKLMNENLVATGNLRSGASGYYNAELTRRVMADSVTRRQNYLQLAFGGQQQGASQRLNLLSSILQRGQIAASTGVAGKQMSTNLLTTAMGLAPAQAQATLAKGAALASQINSVGDTLDAAVNMGAGAYMGYTGAIPGMEGGGGALAGASIGGSGVSQLSLLSKLLK